MYMFFELFVGTYFIEFLVWVYKDIRIKVFIIVLVEKIMVQQIVDNYVIIKKGLNRCYIK